MIIFLRAGNGIIKQQMMNLKAAISNLPHGGAKEENRATSQVAETIALEKLR